MLEQKKNIAQVLNTTADTNLITCHYDRYREIIMNHINKPFGFNPMANSHHAHAHQPSRTAHPEQTHENRSSNNVSISERSVVALKMVHQSISARFSSTESFSNAKEIEEPKAEKLNVFDFEAVAKNVMTFVNSSLNSAKSRGASSSELQEMLTQAREGANSGIDEAIEELGELNVLDEELSDGIEKARDLINAGIDKTEEQILGKSLPSQSSSPSLVSKALNITNERYAGQENSSDLSITTADGDIVNISFSALKENQSIESLSYYADKDSNQMNYNSSSSSYSSMNFSYSVQGDLDEDEMLAIESLIKDISKIENDFFSGNIDDAFNKAVELGYDEEQLSSFSLELRQTQTSYVSQAYNEIANYTEDVNEELNNVVKPVLDFIGDFKELQDNANNMLDKEGDQFSQLLESVFNAEFDQNQKLLSQFNKFIEKLL